MKDNEEESGQSKREVNEGATRGKGENINKNISDNEKNYHHNERHQEQREQQVSFLKVCWTTSICWYQMRANDKQQVVVVGQMFLFRGRTTATTSTTKVTTTSCVGCGLHLLSFNAFRVSFVDHCWDANKMYSMWIFVETINALCKRSLTGKVSGWEWERRVKLEAANASWRLMWN